jgi:hypothetical protein
MRKGYMGAMFLLNDQNETVAAATGSEATSEHEQGSQALQAKLGARAGSQTDVSERVITRVPREFGAGFLEDGSFLVSTDFERAKGYLTTELRFFQLLSAKDQEVTLAGAWDSSNFALRARGVDVPRLQELADAIPRKETMFGGLLNQGNWWQARGVIIAITTRVPQKEIDAEQSRVDSTRRLHATAGRILPGLEEKLRASGKRWFAISPRWVDDKESGVKFWLNPYEQNRYNSGLFTAEELLAWAQNTGPVVKAVHA